jgi:hypothetical protein
MRKEIALCLCLGGCSTVFPYILPDTRTPTDHAHEVEPKCKGSPETAAASFLAAASVDRVEPENAVVPSGNGQRSNLNGARIYLVPMTGLSPETITRNLECHQVRATLGLVASQDDDPYVLPGRWLDISAHSEGDGFSVRVTIDSIADARRVLDRAQLLVAPRRHVAPLQAQ